MLKTELEDEGHDRDGEETQETYGWSGEWNLGEKNPEKRDVRGMGL